MENNSGNDKAESIASAPLSSIVFPAGALSQSSVKLDILVDTADYFALAKPSGVVVRQHPWESALNLDRACNDALLHQRKWTQVLGCEKIGSVYPLDQAIGGVVLFAKHAEALERARNAFGSYQMTFEFCLLVWEGDGVKAEAELHCDMPMLADFGQQKLLPARRRGKRCETHFRRLQATRGGWSLWQAKSSYPRLHQIRAHAQLMGLAIAGDSQYGTQRVPIARELLGGGSGPGLQKPLLESVGVHLGAVRLPAELVAGDCECIKSEPPADFTNCLRKAKWL